MIEDVEDAGPASGKSNVIDLMAALKASVEGKKATSDTEKKPAAKATPKNRQPAAAKPAAPTTSRRKRA